MSTQSLAYNRSLIDRYTEQPSTLPEAIRSEVEALFGGGAEGVIQLYAFADLNAQLKLDGQWICLGAHYVALSKELDPGDIDTQLVARSKIQHVREIPGLSCTTLILEGDADEAPLLKIRYSHRQQQSISGIVFVLKQALEGASYATPDADDHYADSGATPIRKGQASVSTSNSSVFFRLLGYLKPYWGRTSIGMIAAVLMTASALAPPYLAGRLLDEVIRPFSESQIDWEIANNLAWGLIWSLAAVMLRRQFFLWVRLRCLAAIGEFVARDLRRQTYSHLHSLSMGYFSSKRTGSLISRVSTDSDRIWDFVAFGIVEASVSVLQIVGVTIVLLLLDWQLALVVMVPLPFIFALIVNNGFQMHRGFMRIWRKWSDMTSVLGDTIPGMRVVMAFDQSDRERKRFNGENEAVLEKAQDINIIWTAFWPLLVLGIQLMSIAVWIFAIPRLIGAEPTLAPSMQLGVFVSFLFYMNLFFFPSETFAQLSRMINRALSSAHRIFEVLDTEPEIFEKQEPVNLDPIQGNIRFENVTFGYDSVRLILKGISFEIKQGEFIGLVGPSGAGKSTIFNMIARFYDATSGQVQIDGEDVRDLNMGSLRRQIGMVMQDPFLFHGTILDNIRYGMNDATYQDVIDAARAANAHDFIVKLPNAYDTVVGERGHTLSGGERQRVSIARAILHNPRILLLDEATSAVDTETERKIQDAIDRLTENRTVIAIAHRLSTLRRANRLLVMKDGRLAEVGTHNELLNNKDGVYQNLYNLQRELHEAYAI